MSIQDEIAQAQARRRWDVILSTDSGLTEAQHRARLVGASDVGAICGMSPFATPLDVYLDFYGLREPKAQTPAMSRGLALEPWVAQQYADRTGFELHRAPETRPHPELACLTVHVDRLVLSPERRNVQIKTAGRGGLRYWDDGPEPYVVLQVHAEMAVWDLPVTDIPVDLAGEYACFEVVRDPEIEAVVLEQVERFWREHIVPMKPPEEYGTDAAAEHLRARFRKAGENILPAPPEIEPLAARYAALKRQEEEAKAGKTELQHRLCEVIGEARGIEGEDWKALWYPTKGKTSTRWEAIARSLAKEMNLPDEAMQALVADHTTTGELGRSFKFTIKE